MTTCGATTLHPQSHTPIITLKIALGRTAVVYGGWLKLF